MGPEKKATFSTIVLGAMVTGLAGLLWKSIEVLAADRRPIPSTQLEVQLTSIALKETRLPIAVASEATDDQKLTSASSRVFSRLREKNVTLSNKDSDVRDILRLCKESGQLSSMDTPSGTLRLTDWENNVDRANIFNVRHRAYIAHLRQLRSCLSESLSTREQRKAKIASLMASVRYFPSILDAVVGSAARACSSRDASIEKAVNELANWDPQTKTPAPDWRYTRYRDQAIFELPNGSMPITVAGSGHDTMRGRVGLALANGLAWMDNSHLIQLIDCADIALTSDVSLREEFLKLSNVIVERLVPPIVVAKITMSNLTQRPITAKPLSAIEIVGVQGPLHEQILVLRDNSGDTNTLERELSLLLSDLAEPEEQKYETIASGASSTTTWSSEFTGGPEAWRKVASAFRSDSVECRIVIETVTGAVCPSQPTVFGENAEGKDEDRRKLTRRLLGR